MPPLGGSKIAAMMPDAGLQRQPPQPVPRRELALLYLFFHLLYAASSPGDLMTDTQTRWNVARRILDTGWVDVEPGMAALWTEGIDGRKYTVWSLGQSILFLPFVLAGRALAALPLALPGDADQYGQFLACVLLFPAIGALGPLLVFLIAQQAGFSLRAARRGAVTLGVATMHWQHSVNSVDETQAALCILLAFWAVQREWADDALRWPLLAWLATGLGLWFRLPSVLLTGVTLGIGFGFKLASVQAAGGRWAVLRRWVLSGLVAGGPLFAAFGWLNAVRFGSPLETGYAAVMRERLGLGLFETPFWFGLAGMLFSPGKGLFVFNPILLAALPGIAGLWGRQRRLAVLVAAVLLVSLSFHARHTTWAGDLTWGTRYLVSQLGLWVLALLPLLERVRLGWVLRGLLAVSVAIQAASVVYNYGLEFFQDRRHGLVPDAYIWRPAESQLFCRFRNLALHALGRPNYTSIPPAVVRPELHHLRTSPEEVRRLHTLHFFPFKARAATGNLRVFRVLLVLWIALLVATAAAGLLWRRVARVQPAG